jgi:hypothetical protein
MAEQPAAGRYKELTDSLRDMFGAAQKEYLQATLRAKMRCYEDPGKREQYYSCVEGVDSLMKSNSLRLRKDIEAAECEEKECLLAGRGQEGLCRQALKDRCVKVYQFFYQASREQLAALPQ